MKKSLAVHTPLLSAVALLGGCGHNTPPVNVYLDATGQCISESTRQIVDQRICYGYRGGYYGGMHYLYIPTRSAPYYANPGSPGYVKPWTPAVSSGPGRLFGNSRATASTPSAAGAPASGSTTVRGTFGGSASGAGE